MCPGRGRAGSVPGWGRRGRARGVRAAGWLARVRVELLWVNGGATAEGDDDRRRAGFEELPEPVRRTVGAWCVPGKEARQLDVGRPVWLRVHDMWRRTDEIRITRIDRENSASRARGSPKATRAAFTAGSNDRRMFHRAARQAPDRSLGPPARVEAAHELGSATSAHSGSGPGTR